MKSLPTNYLTMYHTSSQSKSHKVQYIYRSNYKIGPLLDYKITIPTHSKIIGFKKEVKLEKELKMVMNSSPKWIPSSRKEEIIIKVAIQQAKKINGTIRNCDKGLGLCLVNLDWFNKKYCDMVQDLMSPVPKTKSAAPGKTLIQASLKFIKLIEQIRLDNDPSQRRDTWTLCKKIKLCMVTKVKETLKTKWRREANNKIDFATFAPIIKIHKKPEAKLRPVIPSPRVNPVKDMSAVISEAIWTFVKDKMSSVIMNIQKWSHWHRFRPVQLDSFIAGDIAAYYTTISKDVIRLSLNQVKHRFPEWKALCQIIHEWYKFSNEYSWIKTLGKL